MKILRIISRLNVGGPSQHVVWLTEGLQKVGFDSVLLTGAVPESEDDMAYFAKQYGVTPVVIQEMSRKISLKDFVALWRIYCWIRKFEPDIIHTHTSKAGALGRISGFIYRWLTPQLLLGKPRKVKIVHTFHGHIFHSYHRKWQTRVFLLIERVLAMIATDKIIVISRQQMREINREFRIGRSAQFEVIPLGLEIKWFGDLLENRSTFRESIGVGEQEVLVGIVGRLTDIKNHSMILDVARKYKDIGTTDKTRIRFLLVGDGDLLGDLRRQAKTLDIEDIVLFSGNRSDPEMFYSGIDIVALTSLNEGTPLSLIEGMAAEIPIITTRVGGVADLLGNQRSPVVDGFTVFERGIGVESGDVSGFCQGLVYLSENYVLRDELKKSGKIFVEANYNKERLINDIKALYLEP